MSYCFAVCEEMEIFIKKKKNHYTTGANSKKINKHFFLWSFKLHKQLISKEDHFLNYRLKFITVISVILYLIKFIIYFPIFTSYRLSMVITHMAEQIIYLRKYEMNKHMNIINFLFQK